MRIGAWVLRIICSDSDLLTRMRKQSTPDEADPRLRRLLIKKAFCQNQLEVLYGKSLTPSYDDRFVETN